MRPRRRVFVVGGAHTDFLGRAHPRFVPFKAATDTHRNPTLEEHMHTAIHQALDVCGVSPAQVERGWVSNFLGEVFTQQGHLGAMAAAAHPDLEGKPWVRMEAACASGAVCVTSAIDAMQGDCDVALVVGVEVETNVPGKEGVEFMAYAAHRDKKRHLEFALFPWMFARRAKHYKQAFNAKESDIAQVVVKAYDNAQRNPRALNQDRQITLDQVMVDGRHNHHFLNDPRYREHIRLMHCTAFTDGASAVVLATEDGLAKLGKSPDQCTEILSYGMSTAALGAETDPTQMHNVKRAAEVAWRHASLGPHEVQLAEVHDCFAITELQLYEALGFAEPGGAPRLLQEGVVHRDGRLPVNTGGGLLGFGHPIGATGVKQVVEIWRQMKGQCGDYQVKVPTHAVTANLGGDDRTGVVMVHRNL